MSSQTTDGPVEILLVEDNPGDVRLTLEAFNESRLESNLHVVGDGDEALAFLRRESKYADVPRPDLILLDLNLPKKDGREVLAEIKADEHLRRIPVVILTTTDDAREVSRCYELGCNVYVTKPVDYEQFSEAVCKLGLFLSVVTIPDRG